MVAATQRTASYPTLWTSDIISAQCLSGCFKIGVAQQDLAPGHHIIALEDELLIRQLAQKLQEVEGTEVQIYQLERSIDHFLAGIGKNAAPMIAMGALSYSGWLESLKDKPIELKQALTIAADIFKTESDKVSLNLALETLRQRISLAMGREFSSWDWKKDYIEPLQEKLEKDFQLPAFGGGNGGDGGDDGSHLSKVVKHPSFNPISPEELEARLDGLIHKGLTGSKLTSQLNRLSVESGRHIIELRKQYQERLGEVETEESREDTQSQVDALLSASRASIDLCEVLPSALAEPLLKLAGWLNLKPECYLTALLTTTSILHKVGTTVVLNKEWDFEVTPNLYSAIIAPSSQKKSPILKAICTKPLKRLQQEALEEYKQDLQSYQEELKQWEATKPEERGEAPVKPERKIYFFTKTTGEGLTYQAARCPEQGILCLSDELAGMLGAQNQYRGGKGSDKQDWLTYYDGMGDTTLRAEGVKAESDSVLLGIIGGIQPKIMQKLLDDCSDSDGGWARFLFVSQPNAASEMGVDGGSYDLTDLLADLYRRIDALPATTYRLSPEAFRLFCKAYNGLEKKRVSDRLEGMQAVWGKSEGRLGKLAVNLHVVHALMNGQTPSEEIPVEFIQAAIKLTKYHAQQVQSLYTQFSDSDALAPHLVNVIQLAQRKGDWIKASDVYLSITKKHRPSGEKVREWFSELVLMGKGEPKGEGRNLQFRVFSDKHPPTPPSSDPPSGKLDEFRQELDKLSNVEPTIYQDSQEKLDNLDNLDDFQKNENHPIDVDEEELDDHQDEVESSSVKNQFLDELSNLSNNSQDDRMVGNVALDDLSNELSNLDNQGPVEVIAPASSFENALQQSELPIYQRLDGNYELQLDKLDESFRQIV
jgi:hypothetical protein